MNTISTILALTGLCSAAPTVPGELKTTWQAPDIYVKGEPFVVQVEYEAVDGAVDLDAWLLGPAAFSVGGKPLGERADAKLDLPAGSSISLSLNLSEHIQSDSDFTLEFGGEAGETVAMSVRAFAAVPEGADFLSMTPEELAGYVVVMETNRGSMTLEFFPDSAPKHVANYLDLCASGFYQGTLFHRVSPSFMIQGGCPNTKTGNTNTWGTGSGPRSLEAEFNARPHERGILSMARGPSPDSASCQFFVMTTRYPALDNKYSVFGQLVAGFDTLDRISSAEGQKSRDGTAKPNEPQRIEQTRVYSHVQ